MDNVNRPLLPLFLKKLDATLLRKAPAIWQSRFHLVVYYTILVAVAVFGLSFISFGNPKDDTGTSGLTTFAVMISFLGLVIWIIYLLRFNVFKRFGSWRVTDSLISFLFYFLSVASIVSICFIPAAVQSLRANQQYGNEELVADINEINTTACQLEYEILDRVWKPDTTRLISSWEENAIRVSVDTSAEIANVKTDHFNKIDTSDLRRRLANADSVVKLSDSLFIFYSVPDYLFVNNYSADQYSVTKILSSAEIYRKYLQTRPNPDRQLLVARLKALAGKWAAPGQYEYTDSPVNENEEYYLSRIKRKYGLFSADTGVGNVTEKKYNWKENRLIYLRILYYISVSLALLLFLFRHSSPRTFFFSLLTAVLLSILTGLLMIMGGTGADGENFLSILSFYYLVFAAISISIFSTGSRTIIQGIGLNLFVYMTPFMPLVVATLYVISQTKRRLLHYLGEPGNPAVTADYFDSGPVYRAAEWLGPIIFLLLLQFLFSRLYRRWYAAPEN